MLKSAKTCQKNEYNEIFWNILEILVLVQMDNRNTYLTFLGFIFFRLMRWIPKLTHWLIQSWLRRYLTWCNKLLTISRYEKVPMKVRNLNLKSKVWRGWFYDVEGTGCLFFSHEWISFPFLVQLFALLVIFSPILVNIHMFLTLFLPSDKMYWYPWRHLS